MAGFVAMGDIIIGAAAFVAGVYFAEIVKAPVFADFAEIVKAPVFAVINWVKAKL